MSSGPGKVAAHKNIDVVANDAASLGKLYEVVKKAQHQSQGSLSAQQVQEICGVIENIPLEELGLDAAFGQAMAYGTAGAARELRFRMRPRGSRGTVTYLDIHDDPTMTIGIFQLPPGSRMPLHDHPGMTVFSRLLYGTLHVRAYDWVNPPPECGGAASSPANSDTSSNSSTCTSEPGLGGIGGNIQPARLVTDRVLTAPADTMVLFPQSGGNIHAFTAVSPCAILDVLTPPYGNRNCTYYREVFPPQWMDESGQPALVPSEDVASWVAWQQASRQQQQQQDCGAAASGLDPQQQQQQQQQQLMQQQAAAAARNFAQQQYPSAAGGFGVQGRDDIIVGLEVWKEPSDFHVARGLYTGQRVRCS
ncbi:hypothetical protein OEZ85_014201 [Tetradesmus obliquus]|uniref:cysteine dioxygenase n=1 Tax=Tetradesmus obliquus TaxID=3088 RepID=A0ABY8U789_TETOB|nr:hypothetical protein OEZ85_014201 [Tetradesmus obliquus]